MLCWEFHMRKVCWWDLDVILLVCLLLRVLITCFLYRVLCFLWCVG